MNRHRRMEAKAARRRARINGEGTPAWVREERDAKAREDGYERWERLASRLGTVARWERLASRLRTAGEHESEAA